jgi:hypothetical protein
MADRAQELDSLPLQLGARRFHVGHKESDHRPGGEVGVVRVGRAEHLDGIPVGRLEDRNSRRPLCGPQTEQTAEEPRRLRRALGPDAEPHDPLYLHVASWAATV